MGVLIKIAGAKFDDAYIIDKVEVPEDDPIIPDVPDEPVEPVYITDYPVQDTLKGLYDLGVDEPTSLVNHADGGVVAGVTGTVTYAENHATFSGKANASRIDTNILLPLDNGVTLVALFSVPTGKRSIIGNRRSTFGLNLMNEGMQICVDGVAEHEPHYFPNSINSSNFAILAMTAGTDGYRVVRYTPTASTPLTQLKKYEGKVDAWNTASNMTASNGFKIGGDVTSNGMDTAHISLAAIHEGVLTDEQLESVCEFVYNYGKNTKGLSIE